MDPVPQNRVAHRLVHHESDASGLDHGVVRQVVPEQQMDHHGAPTRPPSGADGAAEVVGPAQPVRRGQHEVVTVEDVAQAARR